MGRNVPTLLRQLEAARADAARATARADVMAARLRRVEKVIRDFSGDNSDAFCPFWVVSIRQALGMDQHGRYTDGHTTAEG